MKRLCLIAALGLVACQAQAGDQPDEIIRVRYDSEPNLVALGILRPTRPPQHRPEPFPREALVRYVPDP